MVIKTGRNDPCPCGSGKKYKKCCMKKSEGYTEIISIIHNDLYGNLDMERYELEKYINKIEEILNVTNLSDLELKDININLYQYYILLGYDNKALDIINSFEDDFFDDPLSEVFTLVNKVKVLINLGKAYDALGVIELVREKANKLTWSDKKTKLIKSGVMIEIGKSLGTLYKKYNQMTGNPVDYDECIAIYDELIKNYEMGNYDDIDHYLGAKANKASILLDDLSEDIQNQGLKLMHETIIQKTKCGYWVGVANSYSILGLYYLKEKDYKQAIAFIKKDLIITRQYGSLREELSTLINLSDIYLSTKQISKAKDVLREAISISEITNNSAIAIYIADKIKEIEKTAKGLNQNKIPFGPKAPCECGSGNTYEKCCGEADFDYTAIEKVLGLENIIPYAKVIEDSGEHSLTNNNNKLKLLMRKLGDKEFRLSWVELVNKGAYQEVYELPDMSTVYLLSAKSLMINTSINDLMQETSIALAVSMLSVSALEAFLNQMIYFLATIPGTELPDFVRRKIPAELLDNYSEYQRMARFTDKINLIADIFTNGKWSHKIGQLYKDLFKLVSIRNELVHFKSVEYIRIIPPPKDKGILENLSSDVKLRDVSNSWPFRLLNETFAHWSIKTIEQSINFIKDSYESSVRDLDKINLTSVARM